MADPTKDFFEWLAMQGHSPLLQSESGTLRFDLHQGKRTQRWYVTVKKGDVAVSRSGAAADCVIHAEKALFDGIAAGQVNATAATLRDAITTDGKVGMFLFFQRLFPGPPGVQEADRLVAGYARRRP
jgi:putative sterol carrier protein